MKDDNWAKIKGWLSAPEPPDPSEIRQTRRFLAAPGEFDPLTRRLAEAEQRLREEAPDPLAPLRSYFDQRQPQDVPTGVTMCQHEPFRGARRRILEQTLERFGGRVISEHDGTFRVQAGDPEGEFLLKSLYNYRWESAGEE